MSFIKKTIYAILTIQEKFLTMRLNKTLGVKNSSKRKKYTTEGCYLSLDSIADSEKIRMEEELGIILKSCNYDPVLVLDYIKKHDTDVFYIADSKYLNSIGEQEGFVYPQKSWKALYLSLLTSQGFKFKTDAMFVLTKGEINKYYFIYHFYNWYTFKHKIEGLNAESQALLQKYLYNPKEEDFQKLQLEDIYLLKEAIKQDKSAIEFVFKLCQKYEASKQALKKLKKDGANI